MSGISRPKKSIWYRSWDFQLLINDLMTSSHNHKRSRYLNPRTKFTRTPSKICVFRTCILRMWTCSLLYRSTPSHRSADPVLNQTEIWTAHETCIIFHKGTDPEVDSGASQSRSWKEVKSTTALLMRDGNITYRFSIDGTMTIDVENVNSQLDGRRESESQGYIGFQWSQTSLQ